MRLRRLFPDAGEAEPAEVAGGLRLNELAPPDRPYVVLNMVATLDGRVTFGGSSRPIGDDADFQLFLDLRTQADAVMVGATTAVVEGYGPLLRRPERRERRAREGLARDPIAIVVSGRLSVPGDLPLLADPAAEALVLTASRGRIDGAAARVDYLRGEPADPDGALELAPLLRRLRVDHGVRSILCEGGPTLNDALLRERLVDELFLTIAPRVSTGAGLTLARGEGLDPLVELLLVSVHELDGELFTRYRVRS